MDPRLAVAVVRKTAEAIIVADPAGIIRLWNQGAERVFGYPASRTGRSWSGAPGSARR